MAEPEDQGYTVKDRRFLHLSEEEKAKVQEEEAVKQAATEAQKAAGAQETGQKLPLPEITFSSFIFSLGTSALTCLGTFPDPDSGEFKKNLSLAKQTIDLMGLLREKTRGNLTSEEEGMFDHFLYDLRMRYIKEAG